MFLCPYPSHWVLHIGSGPYAFIRCHLLAFVHASVCSYPLHLFLHPAIPLCLYAPSLVITYMNPRSHTHGCSPVKPQPISYERTPTVRFHCPAGVLASGVIAGGVGDDLHPSLELLERLRQLVLSGRMERAQLEWLEQVQMFMWAAMHSGGKWCACGP